MASEDEGRKEGRKEGRRWRKVNEGGRKRARNGGEGKWRGE